eukprot:CAMPEP_0115876032 /NCGR_PEP_ID=MMETSP0287-20121206/25431_1 /TAXON_ID=412157 /ORGANISM="Chrysochromulina rotalis, Strain UIO044" /LENGTH=67 /DNA_ID=CAMNT_0003331369 /DNA_START=193 /DNA_END=393 /DNA_ORIENTATION=-
MQATAPTTASILGCRLSQIMPYPWHASASLQPRRRPSGLQSPRPVHIPMAANALSSRTRLAACAGSR